MNFEKHSSYIKPNIYFINVDYKKQSTIIHS